MTNATTCICGATLPGMVHRDECPAVEQITGIDLDSAVERMSAELERRAWLLNDESPEDLRAALKAALTATVSRRGKGLNDG